MPKNKTLGHWVNQKFATVENTELQSENMDHHPRRNANIDLVCLIVSVIVLVIALLFFLTEIMTLFASCLRMIFTDNNVTESVTQTPVGNTEKTNVGNETSCQENIEMQQFWVTN